MPPCRKSTWCDCFRNIRGGLVVNCNRHPPERELGLAADEIYVDGNLFTFDHGNTEDSENQIPNPEEDKRISESIAKPGQTSKQGPVMVSTREPDSDNFFYYGEDIQPSDVPPSLPDFSLYTEDDDENSFLSEEAGDEDKYFTPPPSPQPEGMDIPYDNKQSTSEQISQFVEHLSTEATRLPPIQHTSSPGLIQNTMEPTTWMQPTTFSPAVTQMPYNNSTGNAFQ